MAEEQAKLAIMQTAKAEEATVRAQRNLELAQKREKEAREALERCK